LKRIALVLVMFSVIAGLAVRPVNAADITWTAVGRGIEYTSVPMIAENRPQGDIVLIRINPANVLFRVYYHAGRRKTIQAWATELPGAAVIVNANYFRGNGYPIGLVKIGDAILNPPTGRIDSGMFEVRDEVPSIHFLVPESPIVPLTNRPYAESFEGHPFLITHGKTMTQYADDIPMTRARRTVIAQDDQGRMLFILASPIELTLPEMARWLQNSGLGIVTALNLDGGTSSQLHLISANLPQLERGAAVPVVLAVYPR